MARDNNSKKEGDKLIVTNIFGAVNWGIDKSKKLSSQNMLTIMLTGSSIRKDTRLTLGIKSRTSKGTFSDGVMNNITLDVMFAGTIANVMDIMIDNYVNKISGEIWKKEVLQKVGQRSISFGIVEDNDMFYPVVSIGAINESGEETSQAFLIHFSERNEGEITFNAEKYPQLSIDCGILKGLSQTFNMLAAGTHPQISKHVSSLYNISRGGYDNKQIDTERQKITSGNLY